MAPPINGTQCLCQHKGEVKGDLRPAPSSLHDLGVNSGITPFSERAMDDTVHSLPVARISIESVG